MGNCLGRDTSAPPPGMEAASIETEIKGELAEGILAQLGQSQLAEGMDAGKKKALAEQLRVLDGQYPGGLAKYVSNARKLLEESKNGVNPYEGYTPSVPAGERLSTDSEQFAECEKRGMEEAAHTGFVLVAGGLGERLGYNGIKVALPAEILTGKCFLQNYCESILALQARARVQLEQDDLVLPLAIMTSGDTHDKTEALLKEHNYFGMAEDQVTLMKQEKVPAIVNNEGLFAMGDDGLVQTKPHGHGDVHALIHTTGLLGAWQSRGIKWVCFFQDTNGLVFRALVPALGVSVAHDFDVNSLTVPRKPGEAVGGICQLNSSEEGKGSLTINVEYNQLDPLLRATTSPEGDVADETGFSPYPGNINVLIFKLEPYAAVLTSTEGAIPEFVNPKYADEEKTKFKKPTRLECMMQDYPKLLTDDPNAKVGFTQMERFICFSAVKNNPTDAVAKLKGSGFAESASSGEADVYKANRFVLAKAGVQIKTEGLEQREFLGLPFPQGAKVVLSPAFGTTVQEAVARFPSPDKVKISERSSLVLDGDITVHDLELDGSLVISLPAGMSAEVKNLKVTNEGVEFEPVAFDDRSVDEIYRIRGYVKVDKETKVLGPENVKDGVIDGEA